MGKKISKYTTRELAKALQKDKKKILHTLHTDLDDHQTKLQGLLELTGVAAADYDIIDSDFDFTGKVAALNSVPPSPAGQQGKKRRPCGRPKRIPEEEEEE